MAEIRTVTTLRYKRAESKSRCYEKRLAQAQSVLAHINAISISRPAAIPGGQDLGVAAAMTLVWSTTITRIGP
jgi:hypothetical protein